MNLSDIGTVRRLLDKHGFSFSKGLGQNFLINPSVCPKMAALCGADEKTGVLEIGPGIGVLTRELAQVAKRVVAVEIDTRLLPVLAETLSDFNNVSVVNADILKTDVAALIAENFADCTSVCVCANLPYYITSPIIMSLLESHLPVTAVTVMVQKEVAQRMCAPVGSRESGAVTVAVSYFSQPEMLFEVSRGSFMPAPNVDSAVLKLNIRSSPPVALENEGFFFKFIRAAFCQRRKTLVNGVSSGLGVSKECVACAVREAGLSETVRAEALKMEQLAAVCDGIYKSLKNKGE